MRILTTLLLLLVFLLSLNNYAQSSIDKLTTSINGTIISSDLNSLAMVFIREW
jgi:hypothetical protein